MPRRETALRSFAKDAGLAEDSKFLSHWFGLVKRAEQQEQLPRPSPWNCFAREAPQPIEENKTSGYDLRAWAFDAGLPEESQFLSHWFCVGEVDGQLPRPHQMRAEAVQDKHGQDTRNAWTSPQGCSPCVVLSEAPATPGLRPKGALSPQK